MKIGIIAQVCLQREARSSKVNFGALQVDAERLELLATIIDFFHDLLGRFLITPDAKEASGRAQPSLLILPLPLTARIHR